MNALLSNLVVLSLFAAVAAHATPPPAATEGAPVIAQRMSVTLSDAARDAIARVRAAHPHTLSLHAVAATGSMKPTFDENFVVVCERIEFCEIRRRDVIGVREGEVPFLHRVIETSGAIRTRGDAHAQRDAIVTTARNFTGWRAVAAVHRATGEIVQLSR